nr:probable pre-mRNA-splicing factor ATP-dependent RNA helicase DEAH4 isoform X2 [Tanacetum cinerariifolium]
MYVKSVLILQQPRNFAWEIADSGSVKSVFKAWEQGLSSFEVLMSVQACLRIVVQTEVFRRKKKASTLTSPKYMPCARPNLDRKSPRPVPNNYCLVLYVSIIHQPECIPLMLLRSAAESLQDAIKQLFLIDAIDANGTITIIGKTMAELPLEPSLARTLIEPNKNNCLPQALTVAAMLSVEGTLLPRRSKQTDKKRKQPPSELPDGSGLGASMKEFFQITLCIMNLSLRHTHTCAMFVKWRWNG